MEVWESLSEEIKAACSGITARCMDEKGCPITPPFPENINDVSVGEARRLLQKIIGEGTGLMRMDIMKQYPWPEPEGVTFVLESNVWGRIAKKYRGYFINDILRIYHTETPISYSNGSGMRTYQTVRNCVFNYAELLNHADEYCFSFSEKLKMSKYSVFNIIEKTISGGESKYPMANPFCLFAEKVFYLGLRKQLQEDIWQPEWRLARVQDNIAAVLELTGDKYNE